MRNRFGLDDLHFPRIRAEDLGRPVGEPSPSRQRPSIVGDSQASAAPRPEVDRVISRLGIAAVLAQHKLAQDKTIRSLA